MPERAVPIPACALLYSLWSDPDLVEIRNILLSLPILQRLLRPELLHLDSNCLVDASLELWAVAEHEQ